MISCEGFVAPWGSRTKTAPKGFDQCGDRPEQFFFGIRAEGVSCSKARKVAGKWYANGVDQGFPRVVKFKQWRCVSKSYGDGVNVKCSEGTPMRFASRPGDRYHRVTRSSGRGSGLAVDLSKLDAIEGRLERLEGDRQR